MYNQFAQSSQVIRANGFEAARQYRMMPNSNVLILDENNPIVYFVQADGTGYNTVTAFDIVPHKDPEKVDLDNKLDAILKRLERLEHESSNSNDEQI